MTYYRTETDITYVSTETHIDVFEASSPTEAVSLARARARDYANAYVEKGGRIVLGDTKAEKEDK